MRLCIIKIVHEVLLVHHKYNCYHTCVVLDSSHISVYYKKYYSLLIKMCIYACHQGGSNNQGSGIIEGTEPELPNSQAEYEKICI